MEEIVEIYHDLNTRELCKYFNKNITEITVAIARMVKKNPNEKWKYKEENKVFVTADGVKWLEENYFRKPKENLITSNKIIRLETENEMLKQQLEQAKEFKNQLVDAYKDQLQEVNKNNEMLLIEQQTKDTKIEQQEDKIKDLQTENEALKNRGLWARIFNK